MEEGLPTENTNDEVVEAADKEYRRLIDEFRRARYKYGYNSFYTREWQRELLDALDQLQMLVGKRRS